MHNPNTGGIEEYSYTSKTNILSLPVLMNYLCFDVNQEKRIDGNFISIYNKESDDFTYYIERLIGISIEGNADPVSGKGWVVYVNSEKKPLWNEIVQNDLIVGFSDKIEWIYQSFYENRLATNLGTPKSNRK